MRSPIAGQGPGKKRCIAVLLASALALMGCDDTGSKTTAAGSNDSAPANNNKENSSSSSASSPSAKKTQDAASLAELSKRYAGKDVTIIDASEIQLDGANAMVVTFSVPLDPNQDFSQFARLVDVKNGKLEGAWELSDNLMELRMRHLPPSRELQLSIDRGVRGINERTLVNGYDLKLTTADVVPSVGFASRGSLFPADVLQGLPVFALNVDSIDVNFYRIKPDSLASFLASWQYGNNLQYWNSDDLLNNTDLVYTGRFDLNPQKNTRENMQIPLKDIKPLQEEGVYLAVMQQAGRYSYTMPATLFTLSDIGVSMHSYLNELDVFTQSLAKGSALKGVEIRLLDSKGQLLGKAETDSSGHAKLDRGADAALLLAINNGQTSMIDLKNPALDLAEFDIAGPQGYAKQFFVFGPRDLYRPGETLVINGLLRDGDGHPVKDQPVKVDVLKNDGQVASTFVWQPENGLYQYQYAIPENIETGKLTLRFDLGDNTPRFYSVNVEDFMPERMAMEIKTDKQPITTQQSADFEIEGHYLYGAPAAGNQLTGQLFMRPDREASAKLPGFEFGDIQEESLTRTLDEFDETMDDGGELAFTISNDYWKEVKSPFKLILQASLMETGGRPVTRRADVAVWPAAKMAGIRPVFAKKEVYDYRTDKYVSQYSMDEDSLAEFEIVYTDRQGNKLKADDLNARLIYERRDYYWRWSDSEGWSSGYDQKDLVMSDDKISIAKDGTAKVTVPVSWGAYRLEVVDPSTGLTSSVRFWAGYSWQDNTGGTGAVRPDQVKLKLDKPNYHAGDKVKLNVTAPQAGKGYVLLESSDGPLWWQEVDVPEGGTDVEVPLNKEWTRHDLYATAVVVRPGDSSRQATVKRAVGILHIPMADPARKIDVTLDTPARIRPNQDLTVKIKAKAQDGKAAPEKVNVLISAVDTGVLNITDYKTPDPYDAFFGRKRYSVDQYDVYGQLIEGSGRLGTLRFGGDGGDELDRGGLKPLTEVQIIAQQAAPVELNAQGEGTVTLSIPDFNGELRLMAQAWTDEDFGHAQNKVIVAAPVISQMALPRFMAGGDRSQLTLDLTNLTDETQNLTVNFSADGMVHLKGAAEKEVTLAKGRRTSVNVPVEAANGFGQGEVFMTVKGLKLPDESSNTYKNSWKIGVRPAYPAETVSYSMSLGNGGEWALPADQIGYLDASTVSGEMTLTSRPPLDISRYIRELYAYPYGCLEQTVSGLYPSLYSSEAELKKLGIKTQTDAGRRQAVMTGIPHLLGMQRSDGSFSLWDNSGAEEPWLTAYATDFLFRAGQRGFDVPADALSNANNRLLRYLQDRSVISSNYYGNSDQMRFAVQAYAGYVLAQQQKAPLGALRQVYQRRDDAASGLALVQLGIALKKMGDADRGNEAIRLGVMKNRDSVYTGDYGSTIRDDAMIIALLSEADSNADQRYGKLQALSAEIQNNRYFSTQESNALYLAGRQYINQSEKPWSALINGQAPAVSRDSALRETLTAAQLNNGISVANRGDAELFGRVNITGYPLQAPHPSSEVLKIKRTYMDLNGNPISIDRLSSGDLVAVRLDIQADRNVPDALVVDLLPAGLELENQNLAAASASLADSAPNLAEAIRDMQQANIRHTEYRDDRFVSQVAVEEYRPVTLVYLARAVTPGKYSVPAPQVESMYIPSWRATGVTPATLEVVR
ncbi:MG2 domain-containing protein [Morganella morganii]|uniref:alpha-2-macroglobulin family protein n=1 Tax=Morganella morganii TaxID=582 RepID=UPI0006650FC0|nr:alpha-2-macroglobulin [Morganella morganii]SSN06291.1 alpha-2-macroglobulin domain-containing protein [Klebsiella pneumoniae]EJD6111174.1 alpha-2-macroglobulin family protein [Morganella morganii]EJG2205880.1 alpha-2-macroglobulin family protein [Morganella morganii]EKU4016295.1 alpha-2-macroglobulin family protein [Morganella morganii]ELA7700750.1 alpha-2-macroglobulin family protein [Morganella morganii]